MEYNHLIGVIGLGYVGLPLAIELSKVFPVTGFDNNEAKLNQLRNGVDVTNEVGNEGLKQASLAFTSNESDLRNCNVYIIAVPTPIHADKTPNLKPVISACKTVANSLTKGDLVIFESTVYPGTTEEVCVPVLEEYSGLQFGEDFKVGYSPERINPGDKENTLTNIVKIVSGSDQEALGKIEHIYSSIIQAGIFRTSSIKVAEAAKVIENAQRDINIAFMNELSMVFNKMEIDTTEVIEAAATKWNFLPFKPGLVGGHCIGVDPYYFIYKADQLGYQSQIMSAGRKINNAMSSFIVKNIVKELMKRDKSPIEKIGILGITFKENCSDSRNTRVIDIVTELKEYGFDVLVHDPLANVEEVYELYGVELVNKEKLFALDTLVITVAHEQFKQAFQPSMMKTLLKQERNLVFDLKALYPKEELAEYSLEAWRL